MEDTRRFQPKAVVLGEEGSAKEVGVVEEADVVGEVVGVEAVEETLER